MKDGWKRSSEVHLLPTLAGLDENIVEYIFRTKLVLYYHKAKAFLLSLVCLVFLSLSAKIFFFSCHYNFPRHWSRSCTQPSRLFCRALVGGGILADVPSFVGLLSIVTFNVGIMATAPLLQHPTPVLGWLRHCQGSHISLAPLGRDSSGSRDTL